MICENRNAKYFLTPLSNKIIEFYTRQKLKCYIGCEKYKDEMCLVAKMWSEQNFDRDYCILLFLIKTLLYTTVY